MAEPGHTILVSTSDESRALAALVLDRAVHAAERTPHGIRVTLRSSRDPDTTVSAIARRLMEAGVDVRITRVQRDPTERNSDVRGSHA